MMPLILGQKIIGIVEKIVFNGYGLLRHNGMVIFIPETIPGERVLVEISAITASYAQAKLIQVLEPAQSRIQPICPHFGTCGGCQLQHIAYSAQSEIKKHILQEALFKVYQGEIPFFPSEIPLAWRRKITLHAESLSNRWIIGFYEKNSKKLVPIDICPIFSQHDAPIQFVHAALQQIPAKQNRTCDITLFHLDEGLGVTINGSFPMESKALHELVKHLRQYMPFSSSKSDSESETALEHEINTTKQQPFFDTHPAKLVSFSYTFRNCRESYGLKDWTFSCFGKKWHFSPTAFIQNHTSMCELLWKTVIQIVTTCTVQGPILDLYSGIGVTAIELASKGYVVQAVEYSKEAVSCSLETWNLHSHTKRKNFSIQNSSVESFLPQWKRKAECIIVNPPRTGLSKQAQESLLKIPCPNIVYISCSPSTLARDVCEFVRHGLKIRSVTGYDLFPQTTHFETIVTLQT